jgi:hypothetical protein
MDIAALQTNLVSSVVDDCPFGEWERIVADIEIAIDNDECILDTLSFAVIRGNDRELTNPYFEMSPKTHRAVINMYKEWLEKNGSKISGFMIEVQEDGRYGFDLSYDKPERLNGVFESSKAQRLANYLQNYR